MAQYYYQNNNHKSRYRLVETLKILRVLTILVTVVVVSLVIRLNFFRTEKPTPVSSEPRQSVHEPDIKVFRTALFQFQASDTWVEDAKQSGNGKYVYRSYRGSLIEHDLTIYIDLSSDNEALKATRIQPVETLPDGRLRALGGISEHCSTVVPDNQKKVSQTVTVSRVTFKCDADNTIYRVLVGKKDATPLMPLTRPDGRRAVYTLAYRDLTANPTGRELDRIVNSFQTR